MRKRVISIILILLSIIFIGCFIFFIYDDKVLKNDNTKLKAKISSLESVIKGFENNDDNSNKECTFIRTLRVVDILDYEGAVPEVAFILADTFQSFTPFVLKIDRENLDKLAKDKYYELTFNGSIKIYNNSEDFSLSNFKILSINETDKEGLNQIQEPCR
jgi:hypothetical protein